MSNLFDEYAGLPITERVAFLKRLKDHGLEADRQKAIAKPFPKLVKLYAHEDDEAIDIWSLNKALGVQLDERWNPLYEVEFIVEVPKNPEQAKIIAVDGYMLDYDRPFTRADEIVEVEY